MPSRRSGRQLDLGPRTESPSLRGRIRFVPHRLSPVMQFALTGLIALVVVAIAAAVLFRRAGHDESVRDARSVTGALARAAVEPNITNGLLAGDSPALNRFDSIVRRRVLRQGVVRVKLWTAGGRIIYSDERRLVGARYPLREDDLEALHSDEVAAEQSDLTRPENRFERRYGKLLEVYTPVGTPRGGRLLFEAYLRSSSVAADARRVWRGFIPLVIGALLLLWLGHNPPPRPPGRPPPPSHEDQGGVRLRARHP